MLRKTGITLALSAALLGASGTSAYALDCVNASRPAPPQPSTPVFAFPGGNPTIWVVQGDWWYVSDGAFSAGVWDKVPPGTAASVLGLTAGQAAALGLPAGTVNGNYQGGQGVGLLDIAQAPCSANRQTQHGIQADSTRC